LGHQFRTADVVPNPLNRMFQVPGLFNISLHDA
jgi:hypothetical protein